MNKIKFLFLLAFCSGLIGLSSANMNPPRLPNINEGVSQGVYTSSVTSALSVSTLAVCISSYPAILYSITVSSYGGADANITVYDSFFSTTNATILLGPINTSAVFPVWPQGAYNIATSSGICINNKGTPPAALNFMWRTR